MNPANAKVVWVDPVVPSKRLKPGVQIPVVLEQAVGYNRDLGPHRVGSAELYETGKLKLSLLTTTEAGRTAIAMIADDLLDVIIWGAAGPKPVVRLR